jgi:DNA-binding XRE family transcriptional regulator
MSAQIIEKNGKPEWAIIPYAEYQKLLEALEDLSDIRALDAAMTSNEELLPVEMVRRLVAGEHPIRVWREHRGMSQMELAKAAEISPAYLSQLETGVRQGSMRALQALAKSLRISVDDLLTQD